MTSSVIDKLLALRGQRPGKLCDTLTGERARPLCHSFACDRHSKSPPGCPRLRRDEQRPRLRWCAIERATSCWASPCCSNCPRRSRSSVRGAADVLSCFAFLPDRVPPRADILPAQAIPTGSSTICCASSSTGDFRRRRIISSSAITSTGASSPSRSPFAFWRTRLSTPRISSA